MPKLPDVFQQFFTGVPGDGQAWKEPERRKRLILGHLSTPEQPTQRGRHLCEEKCGGHHLLVTDRLFHPPPCVRSADQLDGSRGIQDDQ